jgi:hypothetical protein
MLVLIGTRGLLQNSLVSAHESQRIAVLRAVCTSIDTGLPPLCSATFESPLNCLLACVVLKRGMNETE